MPNLSELLKKQEALQAKISKAKAVENAQARKEETRLKVIVGAAFLADVEIHPESRSAVMAVLQRAIKAERDREFLKAKGWL